MPHLDLSPCALKSAYPGPVESKDASGLVREGDPEMLDAPSFSRT